MSAKSRNTPVAWVDPDDAPELTDEFFERATPKIADRVVTPEVYASAARRGRPSQNKQSTTVRFDIEVLNAFRATGKGWQTRMNDALRDWLKTHPLA
jgi:uncharacterized protein (DUF4415 family)